MNPPGGVINKNLVGWIVYYLGCPPAQIQSPPITTRIITFLVGNPYINFHLPLLLGGGQPNILCIFSGFLTCKYSTNLEVIQFSRTICFNDPPSCHPRFFLYIKQIVLISIFFMKIIQIHGKVTKAWFILFNWTTASRPHVSLGPFFHLWRLWPSFPVQTMLKLKD